MEAFAERTWGATQEHLRSLLGSDTYNLWFAPLRARAQDDNNLVLEVADDFCQIWLKENYVGLLEDAVALVSGHPLKIRFEVGPSGVGTPPGDPNPGPVRAADSRESYLNRGVPRQPSRQHAVSLPPAGPHGSRLHDGVSLCVRLTTKFSGTLGQGPGLKPSFLCVSAARLKPCPFKASSPSFCCSRLSRARRATTRSRYTARIRLRRRT